MKKPKTFPEQKQELPGNEHKMNPEPEIIRENYTGSGKLLGKTAFITGGDSGIGRSAAVHFAREGANIAIVYLKEDKDAKLTKEMIEKEGQQCLLISGDLKDEKFCKEAVKKCVSTFKTINVLVNNAAIQFPQNELEKITAAQLHKTFETNIYPYFYITKAALPHLKEGDTIINTSSVTAYRGSEHLADYASTKGAIVSFTRSLSSMLAKRKIRVNGVAPGPIWTPLIVATFDKVSDFGKDNPMERAGQPSEVGPAYVFLACEDSSYITGQFIHINGGELVGG
ncbi:SDR family oxidoreductase [Flavobacterium johnsoniae]|jgi:NAD(P)-dependent dehydrogenase (short-subunit alcohol dehydrogenase family)|uniref:NAD(P)-dependent dehydrogenase, short-chain alcohol dehydrogenase family n=2 Tax=Flavobacterium johnsoniae TaxID=986 RepID=A0A1M5MMS3_FLAJO|nr:SDR family oxidoreductase [Flavobacterium johnsoniae]ABQ06370.1 short-chain dehydrogenase/reductase SDR [Flavobacterium johnsoniae UW101]OXE95374.1 NAD(P)-dependent oxidoreductase [Flavobacterium johnsoniae UW101]WQG82119.1 SDR family oxidoreductase [Flavobacterium johnsoniae UW101]SHG78497.1 NAD(P)-dependent dehydrogenase, short-chain alcohol dehydrogenase family [Flavobacterium johnsoniae]SHK73242.1 NAD(P)-dependent dehydrogenase, short-chain alcohol dehydrogenase family [Flavobacterium j